MLVTFNAAADLDLYRRCGWSDCLPICSISGVEGQEKWELSTSNNIIVCACSHVLELMFPWLLRGVAKGKGQLVWTKRKA